MKTTRILPLVFGGLTLALSTTSCDAQQIKVELRLHRIGPIAYLPIKSEVIITNLGTGKIELMKPTQVYPPLHMQVEGPGIFPTGAGMQVDWVPSLIQTTALRKNESITIWNRSFAMDEGVMAPGHYRVRAVFDSKSSTVFARFVAHAESEWVEVNIEAPTGIDKQHLDAAEALYGHPISPDQPSLAYGFAQGAIIDKKLFGQYLGSYYTMPELLGQNGMDSVDPPEVVLPLVRAHKYAVLPAIYLATGEQYVNADEYSRWFVSGARVFLKEHPSSWIDGIVKIRMALHLQSLGEQTEADEILREAFSAPGTTGEWAKRYSALAKAAEAESGQSAIKNK